MLTQDTIDKFYADVECMEMKFPVAVISKALRVNKGNVSRILSKKLQPSESFIKEFYEKVHKSSKNVAIASNKKSNHDEVIEAKNETLELLKKEVARLQFQIDINLAAVLETLREIYAKVSENQRLLNVLMGSDLGGEEDLEVRPYRKPNKDQKKKGNPN
jgi:ribosomal protein L16 Arg81 hydroxylase